MKSWMGVVCLGMCLVGQAFAAEAGPESGDTGRFKHFQLTLRGWDAAIDTETSLLTTWSGGSIDASDEIGMGDDTVPELRARWQINGRHALELRVMRMGYSGDDVVSESVHFDDDYFLFLNRTRASVDMTYATLGWHWGVIAPECGVFRLETIVNVAYADVDASYAAYRILWPFWPSDKDGVDVAGAIPTVGLAATLTPVKWVDVFAEVAGMTAGKYGYILDFEAGLRVKPCSWFAVEGGYRNLTIEGRDGGDDAEVEFSGPFLGARFSF